MTDSRFTPFNGRVAHSSLRGKVDAERFTDGDATQVIAPRTDILDSKGGARQRELLLGARFTVLESRDGLSFGIAARDGYVGYVDSTHLSPETAPPTHWVRAIRTYAKHVPELKDTGPAVDLSFGSHVRVTSKHDQWAEIEMLGSVFFVPFVHLWPVEKTCDDPVSVAQMFLGTPYLWCGDSSFGIDCSGLVQAAHLACGISCPADSDQQQAHFGEPLGEDENVQTGDLIFWKGHVALCIESTKILHANATDMAVVCEPLQEAIERIEASGGGPVTARKRL